MWFNGSYSFMLLEIEIENCTLEYFLKRGEESEGFPTFVHEYVHYLQHCTTTWGFTNFHAYLGCILNSLVVNPEEGSKRVMPLYKYNPPGHSKTLENFYQHAWIGLDLEDPFGFATSSEELYSIIEKEVYDPYFDKTVLLHYLTVGHRLVPLNPIVIAENMAWASTQLAAGFTLAQADLASPNWGLQYTAIYYYLREHLPSKDYLRLTYELSEAALMIIPYSATMESMLSYISQHRSLLIACTEDEIVDRIRQHIQYRDKSEKLINASISQFDALIVTLQKHAPKYSFFEFVLPLVETIRAGLKYRRVTSTTYAPRFTMTIVNQWANVINSPLLRFHETPPCVLKDSDPLFINALAHYNAILTLYDQLYFEEPGPCALNPSNTLCTHPREYECGANAMQVPSNSSLRNCMMYNTLKLTGMLVE